MDLASEKQVNFINSLRGDRVISTEQDMWLNETLATLSKSKASKVIEGLLKLPRKPQPKPAQDANLPDVPQGRYAIEDLDGVTKFYHVDRPTQGKWAGRTFIKVRASDTLYPVKHPDSRLSILKAIAENPQAAAQRFGLLMGECAICGRSLTDEYSRQHGIGPICAQRLGWK